jgi:hypothetical protein
LYDHQLRIIMDDEGAGHVICGEQRKTAKEQRDGWLFLGSPDRRRPRISPKNERSLADNMVANSKNSERHV